MPSSVLLGADYRERFSADLTAAEKSVFVQSSSVNPKGLDSSARRWLRQLHVACVTISVKSPRRIHATSRRTRNPSCYWNRCGCAVKRDGTPQPDLAIIDGKTIWYGEIDFCSFNRKAAQSLRFESVSVAHDLLA